MAYLVATAKRSDLGAVQKSSPETWRRVRRYNLPVQLALAAAEEVIGAANDPQRATVISLAPCHPGSADLYRWGDVVTAGMARGDLGDLRMNPTQTLHAVDNLAMSAFAIAYGNHADCLGLGGAAGQAWCGLEAVLERLDDNPDNAGAEEALLMAGDQDSTDEPAAGVGVALLFSKRARRYAPREGLGRLVRIVRIEKRALSISAKVQPHAAAGLVEFIATIEKQDNGLLSYDVPIAQTDGCSSVDVLVEISS
jgi:hypothetical protein